MIKPDPLEKGDKIGIISPSSGLAGQFPHRVKRAKEFFQSKGYEVEEYKTTRKVNASIEDREQRAEDLMSAFTSKDIKAILSTIGGKTANTLLPYLDFAEIADNPTFFSGYSDITVLHYAIRSQSELVTFYGPSAMNQFGEYPEPFNYTIKKFQAASQGRLSGTVEPSSKWSEEVLNWREKNDLTRPRNRNKNPGYEWLNGGKAEGELIGGCLPSINNLLGTKYWPDHEESIMILETPEGSKPDSGMDIQKVRALLTNLELAEIFDKINGLVVGRPFQYNSEEKRILKRKLEEIAEKYNLPALYGADIGHTDPQVTLPLGARARIDSSKNEFSILEEGVK